MIPADIEPAHPAYPAFLFLDQQIGLTPTLDGRTLEHSLAASGMGLVAGVDEAGRGSCAGPISVAACVLPDQPIPELAGLTDSKKLTERKREHYFDLIREHAIAYSIIHISAADIDRDGIQHANIDGMRRAVADLGVDIGYVLTDAMEVAGLASPHLPVKKGDQLCRCISAASVLAKVSRDRAMVELDAQFPVYGFAGHKGYNTKAHLDAVSLHGGSPVHRYTYKNVAAAQAAFESRQGGDPASGA